MSIAGILVVLTLMGLFLWAIQVLPLDATIQRIIQVVVIVLAVLYVLQGFGLLPGNMHVVN